MTGMVFGWIKARRRRKLLAIRAPREWARWLAEDLWFYRRLQRDDQWKLMDLSRVFIAEKHWEGREGLVLTDRIKLSIAAQACLLILHIEHDYYRRVGSIFVFPVMVGATMRFGNITEVLPISGAASDGGPILLCWDAVRGGAMNPTDGHNVVFHEFAHALDYLDHYTDGTPPITGHTNFNRWVDVMTAHYQQLIEQVSAGRRSVLDDYGSVSPAEFFAVATETFFEKPVPMKQQLPHLYEILQDYFKQDPAGWRMV